MTYDQFDVVGADNKQLRARADGELLNLELVDMDGKIAEIRLTKAKATSLAELLLQWSEPD